MRPTSSYPLLWKWKMQFIPGAVRKCLSSSSTKNKWAELGEFGGYCCGARVETIGWIQNRTDFSVFSGRPQDVFNPFGDGTWSNIERAGGEALRSRAVVERMLGWKSGTKGSWKCCICFNFKKQGEANAVRYLQYRHLTRCRRILGYHCLLSPLSGRI